MAHRRRAGGDDAEPFLVLLRLIRLAMRRFGGLSS
jgi:hypothetical protein